MPYWRAIFVVVVGPSTGGCLFSAYQIASMTASGISYVFSGRGMGDHALSLALDRDCSTLRLFEAKEICVEYGPQYENSWDAMAATWRIPGTDEAEEGQPVLARAAIANVPSGGPGEAGSIGPAAVAAAGWDPGPVEQAVPANTATSVVTRRSPGFDLDALVPVSFRSVDTDLLPAVGRRRDMPVDPALDNPVSRRPVEPAVYLVIGSFQDSGNAQRLVDRHGALDTALMTLDSGGRKIYRVIAGPIVDGELKEIRARFVRAGIRNSWAVRLCRSTLSLPPCQGSAVQQAVLPGH